MQAVILCGGLGTRLKKLYKNTSIRTILLILVLIMKGQKLFGEKIFSL